MVAAPAHLALHSGVSPGACGSIHHNETEPKADREECIVDHVAGYD